MKKTSLMLTISMAFLMLFSVYSNAQKFPDLDVSPMDAASYPSSYKVSDKIVKIIYSRPQLKGRRLEKLVRKGEVWRTGANEAAEITFYKDVAFGDQKVKAGTYSFFIKNNGDKWTAILSEDLNVWGSYSYSEDNDVARATAAVQTPDQPLEAFSIVFDDSDDGINMYVGWGNSMAVFPIR